MNRFNQHQFILDQQNQSMNTAEFNRSFIPPPNIIERPNFTNPIPRVVMHNNLNDNLLSETVVEYYINIDSDDRKLEAYPDPFNYIVSFKSQGKGTYRSFKHDNEMPETPSPVITREFKNVKYIKLDHVVLSRYNTNRFTLEQHITVDTQNNKVSSDYLYLDKHCHKAERVDKCVICKQKDKCKTYDLGDKCNLCFDNKQKNNYTYPMNERCHTCNELTCKCLINDRNKFLILKVDGLKNNRLFSTNTGSSDDAFILHVDRSSGNCHNVWLARHGICTYPNSSLYNLDRMTIEFCDNRGERLKTGIILHYIVKINDAIHKICIIFGTIDDSVKQSISGIKLELPISQLFKMDNWHKLVFNMLLGHIKDQETRCVLNNNYQEILTSVKDFNIDEVVKPDITNNVFFVVGTVQNELNTLNNYEQ
jgi:hypothetical protein